MLELMFRVILHFGHYLRARDMRKKIYCRLDVFFATWIKFILVFYPGIIFGPLGLFVFSTHYVAEIIFHVIYYNCSFFFNQLNESTL